MFDIKKNIRKITHCILMCDKYSMFHLGRKLLLISILITLISYRVEHGKYSIKHRQGNCTVIL